MKVALAKHKAKLEKFAKEYQSKSCDNYLNVEEKRAFLLDNGIALWDVIASCEIEGSSDSSIKNVVANDISCILNSADIRKIFVNGKTAEKLFRKYVTLPEGVTFHGALASTSPAYTMPFEKKKEDWSRILAVLNRGKEEESCLRETRLD